MPAKDPLEMSGLEPDNIAAVVESKKKKPVSELDKAKEARLSQKEARLASGVEGRFATATPPPPPISAPEIDKSALLDKLGAYRERFPHLKKRNTVSVKSSADDILDEIHFCEMQLGSRQDNSVGSMILHGAMLSLETVTRDVWNPMGLNLNGLGKVTKDNMEEFQPIVDELMIKHGAGMYISPETRLVLAMGAIVMTVHAANSGDARVAVALEKMNQKVPVNIGKDL